MTKIFIQTLKATALVVSLSVAAQSAMACSIDTATYNVTNVLSSMGGEVTNKRVGGMQTVDGAYKLTEEQLKESDEVTVVYFSYDWKPTQLSGLVKMAGSAVYHGSGCTEITMGSSAVGKVN